MKKKPVGIIGMGLMGYAILLNLIRDGLHVVGTDIKEEACKKAREAGCEVVGNVAAVAEKCDHIITSLSTEKAYFSVVDELKNSCRPGSIVIETSTLSIEDKEKGRDILAEKDIIMLDSPISGNSSKAVTGKTVISTPSGDHDAIEKIGYILSGFSKEWFDVGAFGNGSKLKFVANHQNTITAAAVAEGLFLASQLGLDLHQTTEIVRRGAGTSAMLDVHGHQIADRGWEVQTSRLMKTFKDQRITCKLLGELQCPAPMYKAAVVLHKRTAELGHEDHDRSSMFEVLERMVNEGIEPRGIDYHVDKDTI